MGPWSCRGKNFEMDSEGNVKTIPLAFEGNKQQVKQARDLWGCLERGDR